MPMRYRIAVLLCVFLCVSTMSYAAPFTYDYMKIRDPFPSMTRVIKVRVVNPSYDNLQQRLQKIEDMKIEREIDRLEIEEQRQVARAYNILHSFMFRMSPIITVFHKDGTVKTDINDAFIKNIVNPDGHG